jgi:hypothetical protein
MPGWLEMIVIFVEHSLQSQKRSWEGVPGRLPFSGAVAPATTWKMVPSRRYRKVAEQEGFAHFDTIAASIARLQGQEQFALDDAIGLRSQEPPYYLISQEEVTRSTFGGDYRH